MWHTLPRVVADPDGDRGSGVHETRVSGLCAFRVQLGDAGLQADRLHKVGDCPLIVGVERPSLSPNEVESRVLGVQTDRFGQVVKSLVFAPQQPVEHPSIAICRPARRGEAGRLTVIGECFLVLPRFAPTKLLSNAASRGFFSIAVVKNDSASSRPTTSPCVSHPG